MLFLGLSPFILSHLVSFGLVRASNWLTKLLNMGITGFLSSVKWADYAPNIGCTEAPGSISVKTHQQCTIVRGASPNSITPHAVPTFLFGHIPTCNLRSCSCICPVSPFPGNFPSNCKTECHSILSLDFRPCFASPPLDRHQWSCPSPTRLWVWLAQIVFCSSFILSASKMLGIQ